MATRKIAKPPYVIRFALDLHNDNTPVVPVGITMITEEPKVVNEAYFMRKNNGWVSCRHSKDAIVSGSVKPYIELSFDGYHEHLVVGGTLEDWDKNTYRFPTYEEACEAYRLVERNQR